MKAVPDVRQATAQRPDHTGPAPNAGTIETLRARLNRRQIPALDGVRAIAVMSVILYHFGIDWAPGEQGVLAFFVLSGFLITWLLLKEEETMGGISLRSFYKRRVLRIFPAFYVYWTFAVIATPLVHKHIPWPHAGASFFYLGNYYNALHGHPVNALSHTWSLAIEEQFYLLWPLGFAALPRKPIMRLKGLAALVGGVWLYRAVLQFGLHAPPTYIYNAFDTRMDHLAVGCILALALKTGVLDSVWAVICSRKLFSALTVLLLWGSVALDKHRGQVYRDVVGFAIDPLLVAVLMVQLIYFSGSWPWRWVDAGAIRYLGRISYSLYLYQQATLPSVKQVLLPTQPQAVQLLVAVSVTIICASASYYVIELPFLRLKERFSGVRTNPGCSGD